MWEERLGQGEGAVAVVRGQDQKDHSRQSLQVHQLQRTQPRTHPRQTYQPRHQRPIAHIRRRGSAT